MNCVLDTARQELHTVTLPEMRLKQVFWGTGKRPGRVLHAAHFTQGCIQ